MDLSGKAPYEFVTVQSEFPDTHLIGSSGGVEIAVKTSVDIHCNRRNVLINEFIFQVYCGLGVSSL